MSHFFQKPTCFCVVPSAFVWLSAIPEAILCQLQGERGRNGTNGEERVNLRGRKGIMEEGRELCVSEIVIS